MRLTHTRLLVTRFDACFEFYRDQLGLEVGFGNPGDVYADFKAGDGTIALFDRGLMAQAVGTAELPVDAQCQDRVVLSLGVDQVDQTYGHLRERGVAFLNEPHDQPDWGIRVVHLRDPDGNLIELYNGLQQNG
jgi:catechol 2,3-dioxygenase-like lactoylglutathione lyase family enzyme